MREEVKVSIITVGMNHLRFIKELYRSLYDNKTQPKANFEAIYVDNCSKDGSVEYIKENYPQVRIFENKEKKGFGKNNNFGVSMAQGQYVALINPDIVLQENAIDNLLDYIEKDLSVGIVVPKLLNPDLSIQHSVRSFISLKILFHRVISRGKDEANNKTTDDYLQKDIDTNLIQPIDWAIGAAFLLSKDFFEELGGFDEAYFLYLEDEDLCLRTWKMRRKVMYVPESRMIHNHLRASRKIGKKMLFHIKSMTIFFFKHGISAKNHEQYK
ncbi:MAG: glycosyltransferase family 2 protein [Bacteroidetes bacterium]|nr:glycosyltransferase family 2 protein [Bacteroidota bacterium]